MPGFFLFVISCKMLSHNKFTASKFILILLEKLLFLFKIVLILFYNRIADLVVSELVQRKDITLLFECLSVFSLREKCLVQILKFLIELPDEEFSTHSEQSKGKRKSLSDPSKEGSEKRRKSEKNDDTMDADEENDKSCSESKLMIALVKFIY